MKQKILGVMIAALFASNLAGQTVSTVLSTNLFEPHSVAIDGNNNLYVTDAAHNRVVKIAASTGAFSSLAGGLSSQSGTNNGTGSSARFYNPQGIIYARGGLIVADWGNSSLRYVTTLNGVVTDLAGMAGSPGFVDDVTASQAQFNYPIGLAADTNGNIFIADSRNNRIRRLDTNNIVTTVASGFYQPAAVAVGDNGDIWVADTRHHVISLVTNGVSGTNLTATVVAGNINTSGTDDSATLATDAHFNSPAGLLWLGGSSGLLISDTGNNTICRYFFNNDPGVLGYSVEVLAGTGQAGFTDGDLATATLKAPIGLARDVVNGGFFEVDSLNNAVRRIQTSPPLPPVQNPSIGYVLFVPNSAGDLLSQFTSNSAAVFNNDVIIAVKTEPGTETYITSGPTPPSSFEDDIPAPGPTTGLSPEPYRGDGLSPSSTVPSILPAQPDLTVKAIGVQDGRHSSDTVTARFQFKTANPIINGNNAAAVVLQNITTNAEMWYTIDGTDPTNSAPSSGPQVNNDKISFSITTNTTLKVRAFRTNFKPSDVVTVTLSPTNFVANQITFGFKNGEASSDFVGSAGQQFYAPVTLTLLPGETIYSLQFNVTVTNLTAPPIVPGAFNFQSMLLKPLTNTTPPIYVVIPPAMFDPIKGGFDSLLFTNTSINLLGIGWLERFEHKNLYDTLFQDLITFSQAHDTLFKSSDGKVIVGGYSFVIPISAANGQTYQIQIGRPSGTEDGISAPVFIQTPTNGVLDGGAINSIKNVTVGSRQYVVGDVAPFRWFNAGDFGDTNLVNNDVLQTFQSAMYRINSPPPGSDFFDAMDSSDGSLSGNLDGDDLTINSIAMGDGLLNVDDVFVTYRRSLDPTLTWYARYWTNGVRTNAVVPNVTRTKPTKAPASPVRTSTTARFLTVGADDIQTNANATITIPIWAQIVGDLPIRVMMMNLTVTPLDGSPALADPIQFVAVTNLGTAAMTDSKTANNYAGAWLNSQASGVSGTNLLGTLTISLPANATTNSAYLVHFDHFSASPNGLGLFPAMVQDGLITFADRSASSWNDGIPDSWRLRYFSSASSPLSAANLDPDGDGASNSAEFVAGTNPQDAASKLQLLTSSKPDLNGFTLRWPTVLNKQYVIECSAALAGDWTALASNLIGDGQIQQFTHTNGVLNAQFYRVRVQP